MQRRFMAYNGKKLIIVKFLFMAICVYLTLTFIYNVIFKGIFITESGSKMNQERLLNFGVNITKIPEFNLLEPENIFKYSLNYYDSNREKDVLNELYIDEKFKELKEEIENGNKKEKN